MSESDDRDLSGSIDYSKFKEEDIEQIFADYHAGKFDDGEFDHEDQTINLHDYERGSLLYRFAQFRLWVQPKPTWARILIWIGTAAVTGMLIALAIGLAMVALYVIVIFAIIAVFGLVAGSSKNR